MTMAADPVTRDNVTVLRNQWMRGDPTDPDTLREIQAGVDDDMPGYVISGLSAAPADVHGFPAATFTYTATLGSVTAHQVMTAHPDRRSRLPGDRHLPVTRPGRGAQRSDSADVRSGLTRIRRVGRG